MTTLTLDILIDTLRIFDAQRSPEQARARHAERLATIQGVRDDTWGQNATRDADNTLAHELDYHAATHAAVAALRAAPPADIQALLAADSAALRLVPAETLTAFTTAISHLSCLRDSPVPTFGPERDAAYREMRRRRTNASRAANTEKRASSVAGLTETFPVGAACQVLAFGHWYAGEVTRHAARGGKVAVRYTSGTGTTREKLVAADCIRAALTKPEEARCGCGHAEKRHGSISCHGNPMCTCTGFRAPAHQEMA